MSIKRLVIKHEDLHPQVRQKVKVLLGARKKRTRKVFSGLKYVPPAVLFGSIAGADTHSALTGLVIGSLMPVSAVATGYALGSPLVRKATERVVEKAKFLDAQKTISVAHARETHPFLIVDRHGDVHLIPKTKYQTALAKAQRTFLKHVVPGRYRAKL